MPDHEASAIGTPIGAVGSGDAATPREQRHTHPRRDITDFEQTRDLSVPAGMPPSQTVSDLDANRSFAASDPDATRSFAAPDFNATSSFAVLDLGATRSFTAPDPDTTSSLTAPDPDTTSSLTAPDPGATRSLTAPDPGATRSFTDPDTTGSFAAPDLDVTHNIPAADVEAARHRRASGPDTTRHPAAHSDTARRAAIDPQPVRPDRDPGPDARATDTPAPGTAAAGTPAAGIPTGGAIPPQGERKGQPRIPAQRRPTDLSRAVALRRSTDARPARPAYPSDAPAVPPGTHHGQEPDDRRAVPQRRTTVGMVGIPSQPNPVTIVDVPSPQDPSSDDIPAWRPREGLGDPLPLRRPAMLGEQPYSYQPPPQPHPAAETARPAADRAPMPGYGRHPRPADLRDHLREARPADLAQYDRIVPPRRTMPAIEARRETLALEGPPPQAPAIEGPPGSPAAGQPYTDHDRPRRPATLAELPTNPTATPRNRRNHGAGDGEP
ncbi:MAG TPA: hypothetical protein VGB74_14440 [Actinoplanes sp.]